MTLTASPAIGRIGALAILGALIALFCVGPFAAYRDLIESNSDALANKAALLQRYRALAGSTTSASLPAAPVLIYPEMPESQVSALVQETVKTIAATAHLQVQGLQVLRNEAISGATRVGVRVRASGDIVGLRSLLYAIETAHPVLYPDNLSIQSHVTSPDAAPSTLDFQLDISGFKAEPSS